MAFQFESDEFKITFKKVLDICKNIKLLTVQNDEEVINNLTDEEFTNGFKASDLTTTKRVTLLVDALLDIKDFLSPYSDLSELDDSTEFTRKLNDFNFDKKVSLLLVEHQIDSIDSNFLLLCCASSILYVYLKEYEFKKEKFEDVEKFLSPVYLDFYAFYFKVNKAIDYGNTYFNNIYYAKNRLIFDIIKTMLESSGIKNLNALNEKILQANETIENWDEKLADRQKAVDEIESKLKNVKQQYDFVLLNKGFKDLLEKKEVQLEKILSSYKKISTMLLMVPVVIFTFLIYVFLLPNKSFPSNLIYFSAPVATFTILLFYFSRVYLQERRALQSQMMQIELRMALCQFIHSYAQDSEELHKKNAAGFEKFENLIFSPIVSSDDKIPSTIDGVDQLVKLIEAARK